MALIRRITETLAAGAAVLLLAGGGARAAPQPPAQAAQAPADGGGVQITIGDIAQLTGQEGEDEKVVLAAIQAMQIGRYDGLKAYLPKLRAVLDHAPASYPETVVAGNVVTVRADQAKALTRTLLAIDPRKPGAITVMMATNVYPEAALMLGSYYVEVNQLQDAVGPLKKGLALQPLHGGLVTETAGALSRLGQNTEALAIVDRAIGANDPGLAKDMGRLWRVRGFILVEMNRLPEAKTAYEASLKAEPNHPTALNELRYIAQLQAGGAKTAPTATNATDALKQPVVGQ